jgi:P27 family predicted phage terminase small subunit
LPQLMRGRKPVPAAVTAVKGNPGKRKARADPPAPPEAAPACPDHLSDAARAEWRRIVPELLAVGVLATVDRAALALYCVAYARWEDAEQKLIESGGEVVKTRSGYPIQNPYLSIANKAMDQIHRYLAEFGMSPSSRMRVAKSSHGDGKPKDAKESYFTGPRAVA